jgi:hypothetical protein
MFSAFIIIAVLCLYGRSVVKLLFSTTGKREFYPEFRVFLGNGISYRSDEAFNFQVHVDVYEHVRVRGPSLSPCPCPALFLVDFSMPTTARRIFVK